VSLVRSVQIGHTTKTNNRPVLNDPRGPRGAGGPSSDIRGHVTPTLLWEWSCDVEEAVPRGRASASLRDGVEGRGLSPREAPEKRDSCRPGPHIAPSPGAGALVVSSPRQEADMMTLVLVKLGDITWMKMYIIYFIFIRTDYFEKGILKAFLYIYIYIYINIYLYFVCTYIYTYLYIY